MYQCRSCGQTYLTQKGRYEHIQMGHNNYPYLTDYFNEALKQYVEKTNALYL
jgi:hypothetical protein